MSLVGLGDNGATTREPISDYPLLAGGADDPWLQKDPWILHFTTVTERNRKQQVALPLDAVGTTEMRKLLQAQGFMLRAQPKLATEFFLSWIKKLQESKDVVSSSPFGWSVNERTGKVEGFAYAGKMFTLGGGERPSANADPQTMKHYTPVGDIQPWIDAMKLVMGRPALEAVVASAFGAPLVKFTGYPGLLMSAWSQESGIGKTTSLKIAQAVWGTPIHGLQGLNDTQNSVFNKLGDLQSLPLYWDELKSDEETKKFVDLVFRIGDGKEKSRMSSSLKQRARGSWQTLMVSASNDSLLGYITNRTSMTTAGLARLFEFEVAPAPKDFKGLVAVSDAQRLIAKLTNNYGNVGVVYAKYLAANHDQLDVDMGKFLAELGAELAIQQEERNWLAVIGALLMGAKLANHLNLANFDVVELKRFLVGVLTGMRGERKDQAVDMRDPTNVSDRLGQFLQAMRSRHTIFTNRVHITRGKPSPNAIQIKGDTSRLEGIWVHIGLDDKIMRISSAALGDWLKEKNWPRKVFIDNLASKFGCKRVMGRIASGTALAGMTEYLLEIDLSGSPLINFIDEA